MARSQSSEQSSVTAAASKAASPDSDRSAEEASALFDAHGQAELAADLDATMEAVAMIVGLQHGKVSDEHIDWDQAGLLVQLGLLDGRDLPIDPTSPERLLKMVGR